MYKFFILILLKFSGICFAFYKLEGPWGVTTELSQANSNRLSQIVSIKPEENLSNNNHPYQNLFLYNKQTGYTIIYNCKKKPSDHLVLEFFRRNKTWTDMINNATIFFCTQEKQNLNFENYNWSDTNFVNFYKEIDVYDKVHPLPNPKTFREGDAIQGIFDSIAQGKKEIEDKYHFCEFRSNFRYPQNTNILINNQSDKVIMTMNKKNIDFEKAITAYFSANIRTIQINNKILNYSNNFIKTVINNPNFTNMKIAQQELTALQKSKILTVYVTIIDNSIIWGLAEDNISKENFHWIIDFKKSVSTLFN